MSVGSIILKANPVTAHERAAYCAVPNDSPGYTDLSFSNYSPNDRAEGGYWDATFRLHGRENTLKEIFENGLDRHVEAWGEDLGQDFEGTIDEMVLNLPPDRFTINMNGIVNEGWIRADYDGDNEVERSTTISNTQSQNQFGTVNRVIAGAEIEGLNVADQAMQTIVDRSGFPHPEADIGGASGDTYLEVFCRGYWHTLARTVYNQTADTGTTSLSQVVETIIGDRASTRIKQVETWDQTADLEEGRPTDFDSLSPAWDHTVLEGVGGFDSETDADGDLNTAAAAAYLGTNGCEITFDDNNVAYGVIDATSVNQTKGTIQLVYQFNDTTLATGKYIDILHLRDGGGATNYILRAQNSGGTIQVVIFVRNDSGGFDASSAYNITGSSNWIDIRLVFARSTGAGNDDGYLTAYISENGGSINTLSITGIDNDTKDWDLARVGMIETSAVAFGGSYYIDEIRVSESVSPVWITEAAALSGSYGMAVTFEDTTERYGELSSATNETSVVQEVTISNLGNINLANGNSFLFLQAIESGGGVAAFRARLKNNAGTIEIIPEVIVDAISVTQGTPYGLTNAPHTIRMVWQASSGAGNDDGALYTYVDGDLVDSLTGIDNDTLNVDVLRYGVMSQPSGTSGTFYMDNMRWSNDEVVIVTAESGVAEFIASKKIDPNSTTVTKEYDTDRRPADIIKSMAGLGDSGNNRWVSYVRGRDITRAVGREFVLRQAAPTTVQAV